MIRVSLNGKLTHLKRTPGLNDQFWKVCSKGWIYRPQINTLRAMTWLFVVCVKVISYFIWCITCSLWNLKHRIDPGWSPSPYGSHPAAGSPSPGLPGVAGPTSAVPCLRRLRPGSRWRLWSATLCWTLCGYPPEVVFPCRGTHIHRRTLCPRPE